LFKVDKGSAVPEVTLQFFATDDVTGAVQEKGEDLQGLSLEA
jgi:hypothetical protein